MTDVMYEFEVGDRAYRARRLDPKKAFHISRRLAPVMGGLTALIPLVMGKPVDFDDAASLGAVLEPVAKAMAELPEEDADYILDRCLGTVQVKVDGDRGWAAIQAGNALMFDWITMPMMLQITWKVLQANLQSFFPAKAPAS